LTKRGKWASLASSVFLEPQQQGGTKMEEEDRKLLSAILNHEHGFDFLFAEFVDLMCLDPEAKRELFKHIIETHPKEANQAIQDILDNPRRCNLLRLLYNGMKAESESES